VCAHKGEMDCCGLQSYDCLSVWKQTSDLDPIANVNQQWNKECVDMSHFDFESSFCVGVGGFSIVRAVVKISDGPGDDQIYAVKQISKEKCLSRPTGRISALQELRILKYLSSETSMASLWITSLKFAFQTKRCLYMALQFAYGDLRYHLKKQRGCRFSERMTKFYAIQLSLAVEAIHSHGILHRDIKPENILLDHLGYLKISDFGVSKIVGFMHGSSELQACHSTSGTHGYMSPEIYSKTYDKRGPHAHDASADHFAMGVTIHELLLGVRPFDATLLKQALSNSTSAVDKKAMALGRPKLQCLAMLERDSQLSANCKHFVSTLLQFDPQNRLGHIGGHVEINSHPWIYDYPHKEKIACRKLQPTYLPTTADVIDGKNSYISAADMRNAIAEMDASAEVLTDDFAEFEFNTDISCTRRSFSSMWPRQDLQSPLCSPRGPSFKGDYSDRSAVPLITAAGTAAIASINSLHSCIFVEAPHNQAIPVADPDAETIEDAATTMERLKIRISNKLRSAVEVGTRAPFFSSSDDLWNVAAPPNINNTSPSCRTP